MTDTHHDGARDQDWLSSPAVEIDDGGDGGEEHNDSDNSGRKERGGVAGEIEASEDEGSVV